MYFGVYKGKMLRKMAQAFESSEVIGFDCFSGLPESWESLLPKGHFALEEVPTFTERNVHLCVGLFEDTLPAFKEEVGDRHVSFIHVDCDLYSSTKEIFKYLQGFIKKHSDTILDY